MKEERVSFAKSRVVPSLKATTIDSTAAVAMDIGACAAGSVALHFQRHGSDLYRKAMPGCIFYLDDLKSPHL